MPIALFLAMMLYQAAPAETRPAAQSAEAPAEPAAAPNDIDAVSAASNLPKDDYGLVAWCHGALAGQLELDPIAHADMISIEGKAKVAARAKSDAEMEKDRREYLHQYERALAAAEKASPTAIHQYGVESEVSGYKLWGATRQKQPIWRMLDWGMWDPNDAGCGDAAKRLYNKASLFGEALKGSNEDKAPASSAESAASPPPAFTAREAGTPVSDTAPTPSTADAPGASSAAPLAPDVAAPEAPVVATPKAAAVKAKPLKVRTAKVAKPKSKTTAPTETPSPDTTLRVPAAPTSPSTDQPAPPSDNPLRGPQA